MADVALSIGASTLEAQKSIKEFGNVAGKSLEGIQSAFSALKVVAVAAVGYLAGREVYQFFKESVAAAAASEVAMNSLNTALQLTGQYSDETSKEMAAFASQIQATTTFEDDAVISSMALLEQIGRLDKEGLKKGTSAALDMSAALGIDLDTSMKMVGKAAQGNVDAFKKYGIEVKKGKTDTESFANALEALSQFSGAAAAKVNTFSGAMAQLSNVQEDFREQVGSVITENPQVIGALKGLSSFYDLLGKAVSDNKAAISEWISKAIRAVANVIPTVINVFGTFIDTLLALTEVFTMVASSAIYLIKTLLEFETVQAIINTFIDLWTKGFAVALDILADFVEVLGMIPGFSKVFEKFGTTAEGLSAQIRDMAQASYEFGDSADVAQTVVAGLDTIEKGIDATTEGINSFRGSVISGIASVGKLSETIAGQLDSVVPAEKKVLAATKAVGDAMDETKEKCKRAVFPLEDLAKATAEINKELDKQGKTALELIDVEFARAEQLAKNTEMELAAQGKLDIQAQNILATYRQAIQAKREFAAEQVSFGQIALGDLPDFTAMFSGLWDGAKAFFSDLSTKSLSEIGQGLKGAFVDAGNAIGDLFSAENFGDLMLLAKYSFEEIGSGLVDKLHTITFEDIGQGLMSAFSMGFDALSSIFSGDFFNQINGMIDGLLNLPNMLTDAMGNMDALVEKIVSGLGKALEAIPKMIKELPKMLKGLIDALPQIVSELLTALDDIILELFKSAGTIIGDIIRQLPAILLTIIDNLDEIILALVDGLISASGEIIASLIDAFIVKGGAIKIAIALVQEAPRIAWAIVEGIINGLVNAAGSIGGAILDGFWAAFQELGNIFAFEWPEMPSWDWPSLPSWKWPALPSFKWPSFPTFKWPSLPSFSWPSFKWPSFPSWKWPKIETPQWLQDFIDAVSSLTDWELPGTGGGDDLSFLDPTSWKKGGLVHAQGGFQALGTDRIPAMLTPGELVIPRNEVDRLTNFLNRVERGEMAGGSVERDRNITINLQVGEKELAQVMLNLTRQGFRLA